MPGTPDNAIFICYRRMDSNPAAYNIYQRLLDAFGEQAVFYDHFGFQPGDEWREKTRPLLEQAKAVVVIMHKDWLTIGRQRFADPDDPVRNELELALENEEAMVIPVVIDQTQPPGDDALTPFRDAGQNDVADLLAKLFDKTAISVQFGRHFEPHIQTLIRRLDEIPNVDQVGRGTSFDIGGLQVIRPWGLTVEKPPPRQNQATDLWILQAKYQSIPLIGRERDMQALDEWLDGDPRIAARLLVGRAGTGKTRLGYEFLIKVFSEQGDRWDVGSISDDSFREYADWNGWIWRRPTLLLLDYAQAKEQDVRELFRALALKATDSNLPPLRLLLLERVADAEEGWFKRLLDTEPSGGGHQVVHLFEPPEPVRLNRLETAGMRRQVLSETLRTAAENDERPVPLLPSPGTDPEFDQQLLSSKWNEPLYLMMAALVASVANGDESTNSIAASSLRYALELGRTDLAVKVARHESKRLGYFAGNEDNPSRLLRHMAAVATLQGGLSAEEARQMAEVETKELGLNWPAGPGDLALVLHDAMPDEDRGVAAIQPDIVAEAFMVEAVRERLSKQQQNATVLRSAEQKTERVATALFHAFQSFCDDEKRGGSYLEWIRALIETGTSTSPDWLLAIESSLPHATTGLRDLAADATLALYAHLRKTAESAADESILNSIARIANNLGIRLSHAGRREEALEPAREAVEIRRLLVSQNADAFRPDLAMSLNNLATFLSELGRREEALEPAREAVEIRRSLVSQNADAFRPALASSLNNLAIRLSELGRRDEALEPAREAVELRRSLVSQNADAFRPDLAMSLNNLATFLSELGRREEALEPAREAVEIRRSLVAQNADAFRPDLAMSLNNLANRLSELGRREEALDPAREAVEIRRSLVAQNADAFRPALATSLNNLANRLSELGRREEALDPAREAVEIRRSLVAQNADAFRPALASSLNNLAIRLSELGRREEALEPAREAVEIRRLLVAQNADAFRPDLAMSLNNLAIRLSELGRREEALDPAREAVEIRRSLVAQNADAFRPALASSLNNLAIRLSELGRREEALEPAREAVEIRRLLVAQNADAFRPDLAMSLNNLAIRLSALGRREEALEPAREAVEIHRSLVSQNADAFRPDLASSLNTLAIRLSALGRREEALEPAREAVDLYRSLVAQNADAFRPDLAMSLNNLAIRLSELGRRDEALEAAREAVELRRSLVAQNADAFRPALAMSMGMFGQVAEANDQVDEARESFREGIEVLREQFLRLPQAYAQSMALLVQEYLRVCEATSNEPDMELLAPILAKFQEMQGES